MRARQPPHGTARRFRRIVWRIAGRRLRGVPLLVALAGTGCFLRAPAAVPGSAGAAGAPLGLRAERVLLVTIDTLRADFVGCYGSERARTRTLDGLAREGVRFETVVAPAPLTLPSHTSLFTALEPPRHGVHGNTKFRLEDGIPTLAEQFRTGGFATAAFVGAVVLDHRYGLERGFEVYGDDMAYRRAVPGGFGFAERRAELVIDEALAWLETAPDRFFLWVHLYDPHANYEPPPGFARIPDRPPPSAEKVGFLRSFAFGARPYYAGEVYYADTELGRLVRVLRRRWDDERTLVAVTSDHGESLGDHGEPTHSLTVYDSTQLVPLVMAGPGIQAGTEVRAPVRLVDVGPTLLAMAGLPALAGVTGRDLGPWIRGDRDDGLDAYLETLATSLDYGWSPVFGIRTERYKYLRTVRPELYDLASDPRERHNIAAIDPEVVAELDEALEARLAGARPVRPNAFAASDQRALLESLGYVVSGRTEATAPLGEVGGIDPKDGLAIAVQIMRARSALLVGDAERAHEILEDIPEAGGWVAHARAEIALERGDPEAAERHARALVDAQPEYAVGFLRLGDALAAQGRGAEARAAYEQALRIDPTETEALVAIGRLAERDGQLDAAIGYYERALASRAPSLEAAVRLAALHFEAGDIESAVELLAGFETSRARPEDLIRLARAEAAAGYRDEALARLRASLATGIGVPKLKAAYEDLGGE